MGSIGGLHVSINIFFSSDFSDSVLDEFKGSIWANLGDDLASELSKGW